MIALNGRLNPRVHCGLQKTLGLFFLLLFPLQSSADLQRTVAVLPPQQGLFDVYEQNRLDNIPNYITTDFLLLSYSLLRAKNNESFERSVVVPLFKQWLDALDKAIPADNQTQSIANRELVSVLQALANGTTPSSSEARKEWDLIQTASSIQTSPLLHRSLDYGLFKPAGRYAENADAQQFFRAFRYASSVLFPLLSSKATGLTATHADSLFLQAKQIAELSQDNAPLNKAYTELVKLLGKRFGQSDDLNWSIFESLESGQDQQNKILSTAETRRTLFTEALEKNAQPSVIADIVDITQLEDDRTITDVVTGWRLLPSFSTSVSDAFQQLIFPNTRTYTGPNELTPFSSGMVNGQKVKAFPRALEILALLGDKWALQKLSSAADTAYVGYKAAFERATSALANASGLALQQLAIMKALSDHDQRSESALAFWTLQRYVNQLYIKQSTTPTGKGLLLSPERKGAKLESAVELTKMLVALVQSEIDINPSRSWVGFAKILQSLNDLQWKQSLGVAFSAEDESLLNELDTTLLALTGVKDKPLLVSVHSNPSSRERLWEATGLASSVVKKEARGALLSHQEFKLPMDKPLDNNEWLKQLKQ